MSLRKVQTEAHFLPTSLPQSSVRTAKGLVAYIQNQHGCTCRMTLHMISTNNLSEGEKAQAMKYIYVPLCTFRL